MFSREGGFVPKSAQELEKQLGTAQETLGIGTEHALVPPSLDHNEVLGMNLEEIKQKFPRRYEMYLALIKDKKQFDKTGDYFLSEDNINEMKKWLAALNSLDDYIQNHVEGIETTLRDRQLTVFEDIRNYLEVGGKDGYVKLPTGIGKTVLFTELIEALDLRAMVVVPTTILIEQTEKKLEQFAPDLDVGKIYSEAKQYGRRVSIITYDSFVSQIKSNKINPDDYDCLILDEVHVALSEQRLKAVQKFDSAFKLGFTATPEFSQRKKVSDLLGTEIHTMGIREAVEESLLSSFSAIIAKTEVDLSAVKIKSEEFDQVDLEKAVNVAGRNKAAVELYKKAFDGQTTVAYCVGIKHARAVAEKFNQVGVQAAHISGEMSPKIQTAILERFKTGEIKVLCNADILIAGFDEPKASICLNLRPTKSRIVAEQRGGRVLRLNPEDSNKHAFVVDFLDKGIDPQQHPVLFASIVEGVHFEPHTRETGKTGVGGGGAELPIIDVPNLQIITDVEEVMRIVNELGKDGEGQSFLSYQDLQEQVKTAGIVSAFQYLTEYKKHKGWPSSPRTFYEEWTGWHDFLEKEKAIYISFNDLKEEVKKAGITSQREYYEARKKYTHWPSNIKSVYKDVWVDWFDFLGKERPNYLSYDELREQIQNKRINSAQQYRNAYRQQPGWPPNPHEFYNEWTNWGEFLGKTKISSLEDLQKQVQEAGIKSLMHYTQEYKKHPGWPSKPYLTFADQWTNWFDFLGKIKLTFDNFQKEVLSAKIKGAEHYAREYKKHKGWPSNPNQYYKDEWLGWERFLRKE